MDSALFYIVVALGVSTVLNLFLKRLGVSQIIGYILTGTILVYLFDLRGMDNSETEPFAIRRIRIYGTDNMFRFRIKVAGAYNWVDSLIPMFNLQGKKI